MHDGGGTCDARQNNLVATIFRHAEGKSGTQDRLKVIDPKTDGCTPEASTVQG